MEHLRIFVQGEHVADVEHLELPETATVADFRSSWAREHAGQNVEGVLIFGEGGEEPVGEETSLASLRVKGGVHLHVHRCRRIAVKVSYAGRSVEHSFPPASTIAHVKKSTAERLGLSPEDAAEHVLQIAGTQTRPDPDTHIGSLASHPQCAIAFDLVAAERVNGAHVASADVAR